MRLLPKPQAPEVNWSGPGEAIQTQLDNLAAFEPQKRDEYECPTGCWQEDFPLYHHHPFNGINSAPGDSWSLTWLK